MRTGLIHGSRFRYLVLQRPTTDYAQQEKSRADRGTKSSPDQKTQSRREKSARDPQTSSRRQKGSSYPQTANSRGEESRGHATKRVGSAPTLPDNAHRMSAKTSIHPAVADRA